MDVLLRIKRLVLEGRMRITEKSRDEMELDESDPAGMARRRFIRTLTVGPKQLLGAAIGEPVGRAISGVFAANPPSVRHLYAAGLVLVMAWAVPLLAKRSRRGELQTPAES